MQNILCQQLYNSYTSNIFLNNNKTTCVRSLYLETLLENIEEEN